MAKKPPRNARSGHPSRQGSVDPSRTSLATDQKKLLATDGQAASLPRSGETFDSYKAAVSAELARKNLDAVAVPHKEWRKLYVGHVPIAEAVGSLAAWFNNRMPPAERRKTR